MTVSAAASRNDYVGTGLVDTYSYSFRITSAADLLVTTRDTDGLETTLTYPTDYSVTGVGVFSGGTITLTAGALASGYALTIRDDPTVQQDTDLRNQAGPYQEALEDALDYATRIVKSQQDVLDRALKLPETVTGVSGVLPVPVAGYALVWNAAEDGLQNAVPAGAPVSPYMATVLDDLDAASARATLGAPAAANGAHTGTTAVETLTASVAATVPNKSALDNSAAAANTAYVDRASAERILPISASVAGNELTISAGKMSLDFRSDALTSGDVSNVIGTPANLVVPNGATLGTISGSSARLLVLALNNGGTIELAVVNFSGGNTLHESNLISTTAIGTGADSANVVYSTTARTSLPYRVIGFIDSTQTTAGTWAAAPSRIQGGGGEALSSVNALGAGQTWQNVTGSRSSGTTYYNTSGKAITVIINGSSGTSMAFAVDGTNLVSFANAAATVQTFLVPPGKSYSYTISGGSLASWFELR